MAFDTTGDGRLLFASIICINVPSQSLDIVDSQAIVVNFHERSETTQPAKLHLHDLYSFIMLKRLGRVILG